MKFYVQIYKIKMINCVWFKTFSGHYIQRNQNTHSFQVHMEYSQEFITYWGTKLTSTNLRVQKFKYLLLPQWHETRNQP